MQKVLAVQGFGLPPVRALACRLEVKDLFREGRLWTKDDFSPGFLAQLEAIEIRNLADLAAADRVLDLMHDPSLRATKAYVALKEKARRYIEQFPQLLATGWIYTDSCVCEVMRDMRLETREAQQALSKFRLQPPT